MKTFSLILHKKFLIFDMAFNILILLSLILIYFSGIEINDKDFYLLYFYFFIGAWQVLSFLFHLFFKNSFDVFEKGKRNFYGIVLLLLLGLCSILFIANTDSIFVFLIALLFISPFLALYYFFILIEELKQINLKLKNSL